MMTPGQLAGFPYVRDLLDQPRAIEDTLRGLQVGQASACLNRRVVLTGMGGSYHALYPLYLQLIEHGFTALLADTSELIHSMRALISADALFVVASQSGRSAEVVRLLDLIAGRAPVVGVTNTPSSPLAERSNAVVPVRAGEEYTVSCKTYVATLAALEWLGASLCRTPFAPGTPAALARDYLAHWEAHVEELIAFLDGVADLFLVGRGISLAAVGTGGLILKESAHFPAEGMGSAAFRHGPLEMVRRDVLVCVFSGGAQFAPMNRGLAGDVAREGGRSALIGPDAELNAFRVTWSTPLEQAVLEMLPVQMLSLALAARIDHEPGKFVRLTKVTAVE